MNPSLKQAAGLLAAVPLILCAAVIVLLLLAITGLAQLGLSLAVGLAWRPRGIRGIMLYSDHPEWKEDSERLASECGLIPLNWNARDQWRFSLAMLVLYRNARSRRSLLRDGRTGRRYTYPIAVVYSPWLLPRTVRFGSAWKRKFRGASEAVQECEDRTRLLAGTPSLG